jgi:hypothetical protein
MRAKGHSVAFEERKKKRKKKKKKVSFSLF